MVKKIVFFDGDGTLWYPKKTRHSEIPSWVYALKGSHDFHNRHLILTPTMLKTIKELKKRRIITVVISTHPHPPKEADLVIRKKIKHFKLEGLFDYVIATRDKGKYKSKALTILKILRKTDIPKKNALMVGDSYKWDYCAAREAGIDALIIESIYMHKHPVAKRIKNRIKKLSEILRHL